MQKLAVIGNPIKHSLSPVIHNKMIQKKGLDAKYDRIFLSKTKFDEEVVAFMQSGVTGFNVTVPFKERIIPHLDELHGLAKAAGAVNTVVFQNGKWHGYNTDGIGFLSGLEMIHTVTKSDRILIIGAGGASKGIFLALHDLTEAELFIANRTLSKALLMTEKAERGRALTLAEAEKQLSSFSIIIQTTSIGLPDTKNDLPIQLNYLNTSSIVVDIIYNPEETYFLKMARCKGATVQNGLPMFIGQGAAAFELFTGETADYNVMNEAARDELYK